MLASKLPKTPLPVLIALVILIVVIVKQQHHYLRILNLALRATSTKIGVLGVSSIRNEKHNYSLPPAVRTN